MRNRSCLYSNPTPDNEAIEHKPVTEDTMNYVEITNDGLVARKNRKASNMRFWDDFIEAHEDLFSNEM